MQHGDYSVPLGFQLFLAEVSNPANLLFAKEDYSMAQTKVFLCFGDRNNFAFSKSFSDGLQDLILSPTDLRQMPLDSILKYVPGIFPEQTGQVCDSAFPHR